MNTIVSFYPRDIPSEQKPGIYPGDFAIPASDGKKPQIVHIGESVAYMVIDRDQKIPTTVTITIPSSVVANSIVNDFCSTVLGYVNGYAQPGIFTVPGELYAKQIFESHKKRCEEVIEMQRNWFVNLVKVADTDWNKHHNLVMISELQRFACNFLTMEREWNVEAESVKNAKCPACSSIIPALTIICPECKVILDKERYKTFEFAGNASVKA